MLAHIKNNEGTSAVLYRINSIGDFFVGLLKQEKIDYFEYQMSSKEIVKEIRSIHPDINFAYLKKEDFLSSYKKVSFDKAEKSVISS